ncbi:unnamed protein product, partial [Didymodactylos carnosus]
MASANVYSKAYLNSTNRSSSLTDEYLLLLWPKENNYSILKKSKCPKPDENNIVRYREKNSIYTGIIVLEAAGGGGTKTLSDLSQIPFARKLALVQNTTSASSIVLIPGKDNSTSRATTSNAQDILQDLHTLIQDASTPKKKDASDSESVMEYSDDDEQIEALSVLKPRKHPSKKRKLASSDNSNQPNTVTTTTTTTTSPTVKRLTAKCVFSKDDINKQMLRKIIHSSMQLAVMEANNDIQKKLNQIVTIQKKHDKMFELLFKNQVKIQKAFSHRHVHIPLEEPEGEQQQGEEESLDEHFETAVMCERDGEQINLLSIEADQNYMNLYVTFM